MSCMTLCMEIPESMINFSDNTSVRLFSISFIYLARVTQRRLKKFEEEFKIRLEGGRYYVAKL